MVEAHDDQRRSWWLIILRGASVCLVCVKSWQRNRTVGAAAVESVGTEACIGSKKLWVAIDSSLATAQPASQQ